MSDMSSIENLEGLKKRLELSVAADVFDAAYQKRLKEVAKQAKIDGFRPGKVPVKEVERRFGAAVLEEVAQELMQAKLGEAFKDEALQIAGQPYVEPKALKKGEPLNFTVTFEVYPQVELADMSGAVVEKIKVDIADADIDTMLLHIQKQQAQWEEVDRPAKEGDRVIIDFEGTLNGEAFENGSAKDFDLELGSKRMIEGFETGILGAKPGEIRDIQAKFPEGYVRDELSNQEADFKITVRKVLEPVLPEINDDFAQKVGVEGGIAALREDVEKTMVREVTRNLHGRLKADILEQLVKHNQVEVPNALIDQEIAHLQKLTRQYMQEQQKISQEAADKVDLPREHFEEQARRRVILGLLLGEVIKKHNITLDQDKLQAKVKEIASVYHDPQQVIDWYMSNKQMMSEVESVVLEDQAVDKLLEMVQVNEKTLAYEDAVKLSQEQGDTEGS